MSSVPGVIGRSVVRTVGRADATDLLAQLPGPDAFAWLQEGDGLVGWGEAARIEVGTGPGRFTRAEDQLQDVFTGFDVDDEVGLPGTGPVAFGSLTFDPRSAGGVLVVPHIVIGQRGGQGWVTTVGVQPPRAAPAQPPPPPSDVRYSDGTLPVADWLSAVARAVAAIRAGRLDKVVLTRDLYASAASPFDPRVLLARLTSRFPECFSFSVAGLVGATPELLVRRDGSRVESIVLAGSRPRDAVDVRDAQLGRELISSAKDIDEHQIAVQSVRDVLEPNCSALQVDPTPHLLRLANVQHLATRLTGTLAQARSALELAGLLHPTAAVCGTPTQTALELIRELEGMDRGRYTGPVGWVDHEGNGEFGIALRCAELDGVQARLFAGGGVVAGSQPEAELEEGEVKLRAMIYALEG